MLVLGRKREGMEHTYVLITDTREAATNTLDINSNNVHAEKVKEDEVFYVYSCSAELTRTLGGYVYLLSL